MDDIDEKKKMMDVKFKNMLGIVVDEKGAEEFEKKLQAEEEKKKEEAKQKHYENCGVGQKYWNMRLSDYEATTEEQKKNLEEVKKFIEDVNNGKSRTLWLCGNNGNAKTMLASFIARECWGTFVRMYEIEDELKDAENFRNEISRKDVFKKYKTCKVFILDETGRFPKDNGEELKILFHILNDRYENDMPIVIVSNLQRNQLKEYLGKALTDRFVENCTCLNFTGESYRKTERLKKVC